MSSSKKTHKNPKRTLFIALFLTPGILLYLLIYAYPVINIFVTSFCEWNYKNLSAPRFLGFDHLFDNYIYLFTKDYFFLPSFFNSLKWMLLAVVIQVPFALLVALVLSKKPFMWRFARNAFIIPNIISSAAIGLIFLNMYDPSRGLITLLLERLAPGADLNLLASPNTAFWCVTGAFVFFGGSTMLLMLAQIMSIPSDLLEAASLDGASGWKKDIYIVIPIIRPAIGTALILASNYGFIIFNEIALITKGGPDNATYSLSYYIYKTAMGSSKLNFARANAAGVLMFLVGIAVVALITYFINRPDAKEAHK